MSALCEAAIAAGHNCTVNVSTGPIHPEHGIAAAVATVIVIVIVIVALVAAVIWGGRHV